MTVFIGGYRGVVIALALSAMLTSAARAATILETAAYTGNHPGDYTLTASRFIGASFVVSNRTQITGIGGEFGGFTSGTIFGAIVPLANLTSFPLVSPSQLPSISLANVVFSVPSATGFPTPANDLLEPLSVILNPGAYGVVFGSGLFGASGNAGLGDGNTTIGSPVFFQRFDVAGPVDAWQSFGGQGVRIVVDGLSAPGPVPGAGLTGLAALVLAGLFGRTRRA